MPKQTQGPKGVPGEEWEDIKLNNSERYNNELKSFLII